VPQRQYIRRHPANDALLELQGCIAPVSIITGTAKGSLSVTAMEKLSNYLSIAFNTGESVFITIKKKSYEKNYPKVSTTYPRIF
jgi:hypothetical protein